MLRIIFPLFLVIAAPCWAEDRLSFAPGDLVAVDGDDVRSRATGLKLRLGGMDAPELKSGVPGYWARAMLGKLIDGRSVICDVLREQSRYKRRIATCRLDDGTDLAAAMVERGFAFDLPQYQPDYSAHEARARQNRRGLWQGFPDSQ